MGNVDGITWSFDHFLNFPNLLFYFYYEVEEEMLKMF